MQPASARAVFILAFLGLAAAAAAGHGRALADENPLSKVIQLLQQLSAKVLKEGEAEAKAYKEYVEWCDDTTKNGGFEIKTLKSKIEKLKAALAEAISCIEESESEIEDLAGQGAAGEAELKNATLIRDKEKASFSGDEAELIESVDVLERAITVLEREMSKNPAFLQGGTANLKALAQSLSTIIDAATFSHKDKQTLMALVQAQQGDQQSDSDEVDAAERAKEEQLGAPDPAAYKSHSKSIIEVLEDLLEKAKTELADLRKAESAAAHNFDMLKLALENELAATGKKLGEEKAKLSGCQGDKATAEGDLAGT